MKYTINPNPNKSKLPPVGTFWRHSDSETVYLRIDDAAGRAMLNWSQCDGDDPQFFSVDTTGRGVHTSTTANNIELLRVVSQNRWSCDTILEVV